MKVDELGLVHYETLLYYDGPVLWTMIDPNDDDRYVFCVYVDDVDDESHYLYAEVDRGLYLDVMSGVQPLREGFLSAHTYWLNRVTLSANVFESLTSIKEEWLPDDTVSLG